MEAGDQTCRSDRIDYIIASNAHRFEVGKHHGDSQELCMWRNSVGFESYQLLTWINGKLPVESRGTQPFRARSKVRLGNWFPPTERGTHSIIVPKSRSFWPLLWTSPFHSIFRLCRKSLSPVDVARGGFLLSVSDFACPPVP